MTDILSWSTKLGAIGRDGQSVRFVATPDERAAVAAALELDACTALILEARLAPLSRGRCRAEGRLSADVVQSCVVTLEPIESAVRETFDVEFWPEEDVARASTPTFDALGGADPEPLEGEIVPLGRFAYDLLGASLDPYPRKADAIFEWQEGGRDPASAPGDGKPNPFAVLARLKPKT